MSYHLPEPFPLASNLAEQCVHHQEGPCVRVIDQRKPENESPHHKTRDYEPRSRAVLLGSLTLLLSTWVPFPSEISCFVSTCVSLDNSFPSVRQESILRPWKGSPFLQQGNHYRNVPYRKSQRHKLPIHIL